MADSDTLLPSWATAPSSLKIAIDGEVEVEPILITKDLVVQNLYVEAKDRASKSQAARIQAWKMICELEGYLIPEKENNEIIDESPDITEDRIKSIAETFNAAY
jgi:hypothetical protein